MVHVTNNDVLLQNGKFKIDCMKCYIFELWEKDLTHEKKKYYLQHLC